MKLQNQLSIKSALRIALPCLASCLLLAACSNEVSDVTPDDLPSEPMGTVRFSASAPFASEDVTTRIGIGSDKPTVDQWENDEPIIWLGDEEISVFFVPKGGGSDIHAKFIIDAESISDNGKSADLINVTDLGALNGEYEIYAFTPYVAENTLAQAQLNLANQTQAANTTTYSHLDKTASMRAAGGEATFQNGTLKSGDVNFDFEHITSFLRFNITNSLGKDVKVTGISISHPNMSSQANYDIKNNTLAKTNSNSAISLTFGASGQSLLSDGNFDAYISTFPVPTSTNFDEKLVLTITIDGEEGPFEFSIAPSELGYIASSGMFLASTRFLFDLTIQIHAGITDPSLTVDIDGFRYSWAAVNPAVFEVVWFDGFPLVPAMDLYSSCPTDYTYAGPAIVQSGVSLWAQLLELAPGINYYYADAVDGLHHYNIIGVRVDDLVYHLRANGTYVEKAFWHLDRYRPICRRAL